MPRRAMTRPVRRRPVTGLVAMVRHAVSGLAAGAVVVAVAGAVLATSAGPASAADPCCSASASGVPSQLAVGAAPRTFQTTITYTAPVGQRFRSISAQFAFSATNVSGGQIQLARLRDGKWRSIDVSRHDNTLTGTDTFSFNRDQGGNGTLSSQYRISVSQRVPPQTLQMTLTVTGRLTIGLRPGNSQLAQAGPYRISVTGAAPSPTKAPAPVVKPTPTLTPSPTSAASAPPSAVTAPTAAGVTTADPNLIATASSGGSSAWIAYMIGALLLIAGIGVIGTILWKRGNQPIPAGWDGSYEPNAYEPNAYEPGAYEPAADPAPGYPPERYGAHAYQDPGYTDPPANYPAPRYGPAPTAALPTQPQPYGPPPPIDPTRQMPRP